jgi:uncharacterized membrane protein
MRPSNSEKIKQFLSKRFAAKPAGPGQPQREARELRRLETLIDTVFAIVIVVIVIDLPAPEESIAFDLASFIAFQVNSLLIAMLGIIVVLVYWFQSNLLLGNLDRTNGAHAALSLLQIFLVLVYLLSVSLGISVGNEPLILAVQSIAAALVGFAAAGAWWYASYKRRLLTPDISDNEVAALRLRVLAEPLTALLTLALVYVSAMAWELGWFAYPLIAAMLRKTGVGSAADPVAAPAPAVSDEESQEASK